MKELETALLLNKLIKDNSKYIELKKKEKSMLEDEETLKLLMDYQNKQSEYNDAIKYEKYGSNPELKRKELADLKYKVDTNVLVMEYNNAYKEMKNILDQVSNIVFEGVIK